MLMDMENMFNLLKTLMVMSMKENEKIIYSMVKDKKYFKINLSLKESFMKE